MENYIYHRPESENHPQGKFPTEKRYSSINNWSLNNIYLHIHLSPTKNSPLTNLFHFYHPYKTGYVDYKAIHLLFNPQINKLIEGASFCPQSRQESILNPLYFTFPNSINGKSILLSLSIYECWKWRAMSGGEFLHSDRGISYNINLKLAGEDMSRPLKTPPKGPQ